MQPPLPEDAIPTFAIAGVDEVGRGPLAGPVVAAAVILDPRRPISGLLDSKLLDEATRETLDVSIRKYALAFCICEASVEEIDTINILHASMLAMKRAVEGLEIAPDLALIDGNRCPDLNVPMAAVVKGDQRVQAISAASIIAKVARDRLMVEMGQRYPQFGLAEHKGYPTPKHRQAILEHGVADIHRRSFKPVREALKTSGGRLLQPAIPSSGLHRDTGIAKTPVGDMNAKVAAPSAIDTKAANPSAATINVPEQPTS